MRIYYRGAAIPFDEATREAFEDCTVLVTDEDPDRYPAARNLEDWGMTPYQMVESCERISWLLKPTRSARVLNFILKCFGK